jgi:hypothetical protein
MKREHSLISIRRSSGFQLDPTLSSEESIILRALAAGRTDRQVCSDLRMDTTEFLRMMREMRAKIGVKYNDSLIAWAKRKITDGDQRIDKPEGYRRPRVSPPAPRNSFPGKGWLTRAASSNGQGE